MYKGYNLRLAEDEIPNFEHMYKIGKESYCRIRKGISGQIESFKNPDGSIDASKMQRGWFPLTPASIFLSHSHKDEKLAIAFAGLIKEQFNLDVFIDSCLWGNSSVLLRLLDDTYCLNSNGKTYNYQLRNLTTNHVHMMLQTALAEMIDRTECVIFLNTPNSISPEEVVLKTLSPWIYSELSTTTIDRNKEKEDYRKRLIAESSSFSSGGALPKFKYIAPVDQLMKLNTDDLNQWYDNYKKSEKEGKPMHALDALYAVK